jgi:aryl-alcohol dehydrogenase-like predicted oxidoreductase
MPERKLWNGRTIPALGMGCWAIGGLYYAGDQPRGWGKANDKESIAAIHRALDLGISLFDTAPTYGAGHSEEVLGRALADRPEAIIVSKFGNRFDPVTKKAASPDASSDAIVLSVESSLRRLKRERIDLLLFHLNSFPAADAGPVFDTLDALREAGKIGAYGWSTDFPDRAAAFAERDGFVAIEHAMNVFVPATALIKTIETHKLLSIARGPLAMGLLTGKYDARSVLPRDDIRSNTMSWLAYFKSGKVAPGFIDRLDAVRDLLTSDGRTLAQGALAWLWARSPRTLPIPGFRSVAQVEENCGALPKGPLPQSVMAEIESVINREPEGEPRER